MWFVSQIGRREHYALPAFLHRNGLLRLFATDIWAPWASGPGSVFCHHKLSQRFEPSMRGAPVVSQSLLEMLSLRFMRQGKIGRTVREGLAFGEYARRQFDQCGVSKADTIIGYTAANLEQLTLAKERGARALHVQVDPGMPWYETRRKEQVAWPELEETSPMPGADFTERIGREWQEADRVIVHSRHSRDALIAQGVELGRCVVIPPAFASGACPKARRINSSRRLRVLFVGNHCLAKGFHVFSEAARQAGTDFEFVSVGRHMLKPSYLATVAGHVAILGAKTQAGVREEMARADVLVFPTLSDGFGLVQLEAMSAGLPVIATPACGEVVQDGINGRIVPLRDPYAIVAALRELRADPSRYEQYSQSACERVRDFSPDKHFAALMAL
jgi:glycosyltransferase involved in cell wall biosynthesis